MATRNLYYGCTGNDVKTLQTNLKTLGYYSGSIDGSFGPVTRNAVLAFQRACSIIVDGIVGPQTRAALEAKLKAKKNSVIKSAKTKKNSGGITKEIGRWNGHKFIVSPKQIYSFKDLTVKGSCELQSKTDSEQGYVSRKGGNPLEVTLTVLLNAYVGGDVRNEAYKFCEEAYYGKRDYLYVGNKKLTETLLMLTNADVTDIQIAADGKTWVDCKVKLTMKQCKSTDTVASTGSTGSYSTGSYGGSTGGYSGTSYKASTKATQTVVATGAAAIAAGAVKTAAKTITKTATALTTYTAQTSIMKSATKLVSAQKVTTAKASTGGGKVVAMTK